MKTRLSLFLTMMLASVAMGCSDDEEVKDNVYLYTTSASVDAEAGMLSVTIASQGIWTATAGESWVSVDPASGSITGHTAVHVSYEANTDTEPRTAMVEFRAGDIRTQLTLTQKGNK